MMLDQQARVVEDGGEPINVLRDPAKNDTIVYPVEHFEYPGYPGSHRGPFTEIEVRNDVEAVLSGDGAKRPEWQ